MPELPEVETVRCGLEPAMTGRVITALDVRRPDLRFPFPQGFAAKITGARIDRLTRRAKYILAELDNGETIIMHLGMSGRFSVFTPQGGAHNLGEFYYLAGADGSEPGPHDHVVFTLDDRTRIVYTDPRRFGLMDLCPTDGLAGHRLLAGLGAEPLGNELSGQYLHDRFAGRRTPLKAALLDQKIIAGLGNIYVCEALNRARLSPKRLARTLAARKTVDPRLDRLVVEIRDVLREAIRAGGSTLRDYAATDGASGAFQQRFCVYDREGEACANEGCNGIVRRIVQSGRSTFYCPRCQR
jgi:formamidopyrimidine-DNA glycosylase